LKEVNVDHFIPERLLENPNELARALVDHSLPSTFEINGYINWLPIHSYCNLQKGGRTPAVSLSSQAALTRLTKGAVEASKIAKRVTSDRKTDALVGKVLSALEGQALSLDELLNALVGVRMNHGKDASILTDELTLEMAIKVSKTSLKQIEERLLSVPREIEAAYAGRLDASMALVKLLPRGRYDDSMLVRGGGAYYSFAIRTHAYGYGSDIELSERQVSVGFAGCDFGFFVPLGDMTPNHFLKMAESIRRDPSTFSSTHADFATTYDPPIEEAAYRKEQRRFSQGVEIKDACASRKIGIAPGGVFALRSIQAGKSDLLIVFRVEDVRKDGAAVLLWTIAKTFPKPELRRSPN